MILKHLILNTKLKAHLMFRRNHLTKDFISLRLVTDLELSNYSVELIDFEQWYQLNLTTITFVADMWSHNFATSLKFIINFCCCISTAVWIGQVILNRNCDDCIYCFNTNTFVQTFWATQPWSSDGIKAVKCCCKICRKPSMLWCWIIIRT